MPSFQQAFPSRYISAGDLQSIKPSVTIAVVEFGDVGHGSDQQRKLLVSFEPKSVTFPHGERMSVGTRADIVKALAEKQWVLNKTVATTLSELAGTDDYESWSGLRIELFVVKVDFKGERREGIRCGPAPMTSTPKKPAGAAPPVAPVDEPLDDSLDEPDLELGF